MVLEFNDVNEFPQLIEDLRTSFAKHLTKPLGYRKKQLEQLYNLLDENQDELCEALYKDLHKSKIQSMLSEIGLVREECLEALNNLDRWASPEYVKTSLMFKINKCHIKKDPVGTVLIIGAWNYPVNVLLLPLVGAIAAGCTAVIKPSELAANTAAVITKLSSQYLDKNAYRIVNGGATETMSLLEYRFDHIFYTGSGAVGKIIMAAAAKHLTPVTLELGGKSPVILANDVDIPITAKRLIWGKTFNNGQTCIAPDYILCTREIQEALIKEMPKAIKDSYGSDPQNSPDYGRIINQRHFDRLSNLLSRTRGKKVIGGNSDRDDLYIEPTVVSDVPKDDSLMQEEIFGPILPIVVVESIDDAIKYINERDTPLALYPFSKNDKTIKYILDNTRSGGTVINDTMLQGSVPALPFGGTGMSGMGAYHGRYTFDTFTHKRSVMSSPLAIEKLLASRYAPHKKSDFKFASYFMFSKPKFKNKNYQGSDGVLNFKNVILIVCMILIAYIAFNELSN
ncbi:aldehyde dehydrogenase 3 family, member D1 [Rhizophagus irregularis]|uniref:Aldehyde dehydrogenase n=3 Tax=Rhizophagus irregularis TaxID=588596 RepID=A0A2I1GB59_9GLOM|nr:aldehyde dehydrogenase 3 family, member D1 [Rhizophagus irregularis DAOM 181602=DAOM 197198]EXX69641.1 Hfd1p [Rhizophagus irregularis DAOM 197198w]PKC16255.1 aldehyde dehydrogenase 3 family, member D1 [Rhizophagus irregularis]PKK73392.1 aldehyde dehydrogenase 3 family, member D1 [Rhizophagus irregularis]PKY14676.1 aldehyde dehydrogenase 3 family, member D1 [Rhizophagus irregularis]PKY43870.1 aldehyde dehydrogenase 3 family, member D1 [Rhizophagus irregularis]|eukprot:XP_025186533.1 aldehyde dehydrogenase 3 family, member D1 [Rhizophagus irregularis DAOM 181602=DAOM 197198]